MADLSSGGWIRVTADSILWLTRVLATEYDLRLIPSYGWLELGRSIRVAADSILRLTRVLYFNISSKFKDLIYQVNLRTAKYIIFMVCFLPTDFSYHWSRLWLLLEEPWRSFKKLKEAWRSVKTLAATDSSCTSWFKTCDLSTTFRILTLIPPDRFWTPDPECWALDTGHYTLDTGLWALDTAVDCFNSYCVVFIQFLILLD